MSSLRKFLKTDFEKNAVSFENSFFDQKRFKNAVFRAFKRWGHEARSGDFGEFNCRVEADGFLHLTFTNETAAPFLPLESDDSFPSYEKRIMKVTGGKRFQAVVNDLIRWDAELWEMSKSFLTDFSNEKGIFSRRVETGLFIGNFPYTPVGVHWDGDPVLTLMLEGSKTMRAWPKKKWETIHGPRPTGNYAQFIDQGYSVTGVEGQWIHCPSDFYHVFEPKGLGVNFSYSFGGYSTRQTPHKRAISHLQELVSLKGKRVGSARIGEDGLVVIPEGWLNQFSMDLDSIRIGCEAAAKKDWMTQKSVRSMSVSFSPVVVGRVGSVRLDLNELVFERAGSEIRIAFNGAYAQFKATPSLLGVLKRLNSGIAVEADPRHRALFQWLLRHGARRDEKTKI